MLQRSWQVRRQAARIPQTDRSGPTYDTQGHDWQGQRPPRHSKRQAPTRRPQVTWRRSIVRSSYGRYLSLKPFGQASLADPEQVEGWTGFEPGHSSPRNCSPGRIPKHVSRLRRRQDGHARRASCDIDPDGLRTQCSRLRHSRTRNHRHATRVDSASSRQASDTDPRTGRPSWTGERPAARLQASSPRRARENRCNNFRNAYIRTTIRSRTRSRFPSLPHLPSPIPNPARIASSLYHYQICRLMTTHSLRVIGKIPEAKSFTSATTKFTPWI